MMSKLFTTITDQVLYHCLPNGFSINEVLMLDNVKIMNKYSRQESLDGRNKGSIVSLSDRESRFSSRILVFHRYYLALKFN